MATVSDDDFDWKSLDDIFENVPHVDSVASLSDVDLLRKYRHLTDELADRKESLAPRTQTARDIHSERAACLVELRRRHIM